MLVRAIVSLVLCATLGASSGCRVRKQPPPYAAGAGPTPELLLGLAAPQVKAMTVPDAKVIANRVLRGNLAFLAQAPARFRGSVQVSGNELVTLAFHEEGYALRYKLDAYPTGFYHGPPSPCAVEYDSQSVRTPASPAQAWSRMAGRLKRSSSPQNRRFCSC